MLLGNIPAKIDDKGRLKVPTEFRTYIETTWGTSLFVTTVTADSTPGQAVQIYPMPVWLEIQKKVGQMPSTSPTRRKFATWTNYYGKVAELDGQGRVILPPLLRDDAAMTGDVLVFGDYDRLTVWNKDRFAQLSPELRMTEEDFKVLSEHGI